MREDFTVEMCCSSVGSINIAQRYNIDRIELCQNLEQGGTTPSPGLFYLAKEKGLQTHVLIRPRSGGFYYSEEEKYTILKDIDFYISQNADGIVIGALNDNGSLDKNFLVQISQMCSGIDLTFHRAFDELCEWKKSLDEIISIGFTRILTSGRSTKIESCFKNLKEIINYAEERIEIMPGGGINSKNVKEIIKQLEIRSIHFSGTVLKSIDEQSLFNCDSLVVDEKVVKSIIDSIDSVI